MNNENSTTSPVHYQWRGHLLESEEREEKTIVLGGEKTLICAEFAEDEDGTLSVKLVSNGPQTRHDLARLVNLLQAIVTHDAIESSREARDG